MPESPAGIPVNGNLSPLHVIGYTITIGAVIVGATGGWLSSVITPINEKIIGLQRQLDKNDTVDEKSNEDRVSIRTHIGIIETKFAEIETQFRNLDERTRRMEDREQIDNKAQEDKLSEISLDRQAIHTLLASESARFIEIETQFRGTQRTLERLEKILDEISIRKPRLEK